MSYITKERVLDTEDVYHYQYLLTNGKQLLVPGKNTRWYQTGIRRVASMRRYYSFSRTSYPEDFRKETSESKQNKRPTL